MKLSDIAGLRKHYAEIVDAANKEAARLKAEIEESKAAIIEADSEAKEAAKAANEDAYKSARLKADMHKERIAMHEVKIIDLENNHLISEEEFKRVEDELQRLQNALSNEYSARIMDLIRDIQRTAEKYATDNSKCNLFGSFLWEKVYRKISPLNDKPDYRVDRVSACIENVGKMFNSVARLGTKHGPWIGELEDRAAKYKKSQMFRGIKADAETKKKLDAKAKKMLES